MVKDIICSMIIDEKTTPFRYEHKGTAYYFCGMGCMERFERDPEGYLSGKKDWIKDE